MLYATWNITEPKKIVITCNMLTGSSTHPIAESISFMAISKLLKSDPFYEQHAKLVTGQ